MSGEEDPSQQQQQHQQATASTASSPRSAQGSGSAAVGGGGTMSAASSGGSNGVPAGDAGAGSGVAVVTDSVVPSLMQVYESMTQSRLDGLGGGGMSGSNLQQQQQHQHHQMHQHHHFGEQQQQQLYQAQPGEAANAFYSSNMQLHHEQQMQFGPGAGYQFSLPPVPDPTFLSAINGSSSMGAAAAEAATRAHSSNPGQPSMLDDQLRNSAAAATEEGGAPRGATGDDVNISSTESNSSVGGRGGRKTRKRSLPESESAKDDASTTSSTKERESNKSRRKGKGKDSDGRWSKRFSWPEELHRDFVAAIFDVGLKHSSPSAILEHMPKHEDINNERVKSHLQKYRINRSKSKQEFMSSYEASLERLKKKKHQDPGAIKVLSGAEVAGHLTYASSSKASTDRADMSAESGDSAIMGMAAQQQPTSHGPTVQVVTSSGVGIAQEDVFIFPRLTQAEKQSPIGASVGYLMGLFFSLKHQLMVQRNSQQQPHQLQQSAHLPISQGGAADDPSHPVAAVYHSFAGPPLASGPGAAATATGAPPTSSSTAVAQTPSVIHIPSPNGPGSTTTATASAMPPAAAVPSTRTNLEENNIMKREMQNQMAVQNKMRALKQQELSKYRSASTSMHTSSISGGPGSGSMDDTYREEHNYNTIPAPAHHTAPPIMHFNKGHHMRSASDELSSMRMAPPPGSTAPMTSVAAHQQQPQQQQQQYHQEQQQQQYQGAGENAGDDPGAGGSESASGNPLHVDDFWQHDVVDDQLFQFLMSEG